MCVRHSPTHLHELIERHVSLRHVHEDVDENNIAFHVPFVGINTVKRGGAT